MKEKVLKILSDSASHVSGEMLSKELGVSRTAVWKVIQRLKDEGYEIDSVRNKGYRLMEQTTKLVEDAVKMALPADTIFEKVQVHETIDSTNNEAKRLWQSGHHVPALIVSREQTMGKGRRGRTWLSPADDSISMTMMLTPDIDPNQASMLTLLGGLAVAEGIEEVTGLKAMIKWPNDAVIDGKKVSGILTEMSAEMEGIHHVDVGIGINVNQRVFDEEISDMATSLAEVLGQTISRPLVIGAVVNAFEALYKQFLRDGNLGSMKKAYNNRCINVGKELKVITRQEVLLGTGLGITDSGQLQIRLKDGTITDINAGEVSVRGLYGYV